MADAIVSYAIANHAKLCETVEKFCVLTGKGIRAHVEDHIVSVGNRRLAAEYDWMDTLSPEEKVMVDEWDQTGGTIGFVGVDGKCVALYCVFDGSRLSAIDGIRALADAGVEAVMITGDSRGAAQAVAKTVERGAKAFSSRSF